MANKRRPVTKGKPVQGRVTADFVPSFDYLRQLDLLEQAHNDQRPAQKRLDALDALRNALTQTECYLIHDLRVEGMSWTDIGALFGVSRQAAQQRFSREYAKVPS